jgi:hypothetical protein
MKTIEAFTIKEAYVLFPNLAQPSSYKGKLGKYDLTVLIPKKSKSGALLSNNVCEILEGNDNEELWYESEYLCIKDGDTSDYSSNHGYWVLKGNNNRQIPCLNLHKQPLTPTELEEDIKQGAKVNIAVSLWYQDNEYGNRVNCNILAVQLVEKSDRVSPSVNIESFF